MCTKPPAPGPATVDARFVRQEMNRLGATRTPYLFAVDYEQEQGLFIPRPMQQRRILFDLNGITNSPATHNRPSATPELRYRAMSYERYARKFEEIRQTLLRGDSFLANLTVATPIETNLGLHEIFHRSHSPYKLLAGSSFVCFSPEPFVRIRGQQISTFPMKGTLDASIPGAEHRLLADDKERCEHNTIVDLLRNDLSRIAGEVHVKRFRYIDRLKTHRGELLQMSSEIEGTLPDDWPEKAGDLLFRLLPAGSISGAPKRSTVQALARAEGEKRGFYTGIFGYFDGENLDSAVLIRFIEQCGNQLRFRSGGGITAKSNCPDEYRETLEKIYFPF